MPELPEVETVANGVNARVRARRIVQVWTSGKPQTFKSPETEIAAALTGAKIESVRRVGKTIVMTVARDGKPTEFLIHLGMTGRLLVCTPEMPAAPHTHAVLTLDDAREVRFVDPRRFGRLSIHHPKDGGRVRVGTPTSQNRDVGHPVLTDDRHAGYAGPGREPLTISVEDFVALFRGRKTPIKAALLNQSLLHGVGNIYADEALFRAGIRPARQAARLSREELKKLRAALIAVLKQAIKLGGSSVSDYVDADGVRGFFQLRHKVYQRTGEPCRDCGTPIQRIELAGRGTHFCPVCQR
ncbi:MAG TPA: bifunctional DNA-formamidopyrimidine glycosylase/DNA-(apurinic or apyrimidinic site) lyase [Acidobacteriaceae bacterium]|nr:bifunctional DNA-formamidopyrimidine glycosylase/DNA-(apurinic or apyrimidinic site) lyase [Acidobacteriaceae bacterium]